MMDVPDLLRRSASFHPEYGHASPRTPACRLAAESDESEVREEGLGRVQKVTDSCAVKGKGGTRARRPPCRVWKCDEPLY